MSVYQKENPEYLRAAVESVLGQTVPPEEVVPVCDGPLTEALDGVIAEYARQEIAFRVVRLPENGGLGKALNEGLKYCSCEWIARMDTDDLSTPDRCEKQLKFLEEHPEVDVVSGTIAEFQGDALEGKTAETAVISYKTVPETQKEIAAYIKQRNPINHPCVMFRKSRVESAGGYQPCPYFEDYDLWVRMYRDHAVLANLPDTLLYMRVNGMHQRRGGVEYAKAIISCRNRMYQYGLLNLAEYLPMTAARVLISLIPNFMRKYLYDKKLRKHM